MENVTAFMEQAYVLIDARNKTSRQVNEEIYRLAEQVPHIMIINPGAKHNLGVGLKAKVDLVFNGNVGTYAAGLIEDANVYIKGNAGWFAADNLMNSTVIVEGNVGAGAAAGMRGGTLVVKKNAASRVGQVLKGGNILIGGSAGYMSGMMMMGGRIVILGDAGESVAESIMGGAIYVAGEIASLGKDAMLAEPGEEEIREIAKLVAEHFQGYDLSQLKKIVSAGKKLRYEKRGDVLEVRGKAERGLNL